MIHFTVESIEELDKVEEELKITEDVIDIQKCYIEGGFMYTIEGNMVADE